MDYQKQVIELFSDYRPTPQYPVYPPYHKGLYLEDYFFKRFIEDNKTYNRIFIPVSWTTCYIEQKYNGLQDIINKLDKKFSYFTISQHDDAVREILPTDTWEFNAGGNGDGIPIPLICSQIPAELIIEKERDIYCSFVGSNTHIIRKKLFYLLVHDQKYKFYSKDLWNINVSDFQLNTFIDIASRSIFSLCPRGYGKSSFRLFEVMQLGSIPVYIYDDAWLPFNNKLNWHDFCVLVHEQDLYKINSILSSISKERIKQMQDNVYKIYNENFSLEKVYQKIIRKL